LNLHNESPEEILLTLSHEINNANNSILLDAETLEKVWREIIPLLDERFRKQGDFSIGGSLYSQLREDLVKVSERIIRNAQRIKKISAGLEEFDKRKKGRADS
jgi:polar amino acid transport system substrate-binding protein